MSTPRWCAIGIDPGKRGGFAALYEDGRALTCPIDTNDGEAVAHALRSVRGTALRYAVAIEKVGAMPGQGVVGVFNFGHAAGVPEGVVVALDLPLTLVAPQTWQKTTGLDLPTGKKNQKARKRILADAACDRWTVVPVGSGEADALWMAWHLAKTRFYAEG